MNVRVWLASVLAVSGFVVGCGGDAGSDAGSDTGRPPADTGVPTDSGSAVEADTGLAPTDAGPTRFLGTVEERLDHLGIGLSTLDEVGGTVFRDFTGREVSQHAHPLRESVAALAGTSELYVLGAGAGGGAVVDMARPGLPAARHVVGQPSGGLEDARDPVAVALHADGDGREELLVVDLRPDTGAVASIFAFPIEDEENATPFATDTAAGMFAGRDVGDWASANTLAAVARDPDGDGIDEVFLVARVGTDWQYRTYNPATRMLSASAVGGPLANAGVVGSFSTFSLAAGELDGNPGEEVALLVNSIDGSFVGDARLVVLARSGGSDAIVHERVVRMADGRNVVAAGVAFADVDADLVDELVIAGTGTSTAAGSYEQRLVVLDSTEDADAARHYAPVFEGSYTGTTARGGGDVRIRETQLSVAQTSTPPLAPRVPGDPPPSGVALLDPAEDVLVNNVLWQWTTATVAADATPQVRLAAMALPRREVFRTGSNTMVTFSTDTVDFAIGHFDDDGLPDAAVLSTEPGNIEGDDAGLLRIVPLVGLGAGDTTRIGGRDGTWGLQLVPVDIDRDSIIVRYIEGEHTLRYSEPIVLAALAAPACYNTAAMGQYTDNCSTTFGKQSSTASEMENSYGFSLGLTAGFGFEDRTFTQSEIRATYTARASTAFGTRSSSEISFSSAFTNGAPENQILATVLAFEQYTYEILSAPDGMDGSSRVGERLIVSIPRPEGRTTRLYSESFIRPALRPSQAAAIDAVFDHTPNDPLSYHRDAEVGGYLSMLGVAGAECTSGSMPPSLGACGFLASPSQDTGVTSLPPPAVVMGSGSGISGFIQLTTGMDESTQWGVEATIDLELSVGGAIFGLDIGASTTSTMRVGYARSVQYGYSIGALDPNVFGGYRARLFAFRHRFDCDMSGENCQSFEVLNYAIDPIGR